MLFQAVLKTKESVTYQAVIEEGRLKQVHNILLLQGRDRFGEPSAESISLLFTDTDLSRLETLAIRLLHVKTWEKLLGVNGASRHPRGGRVEDFSAVLNMGESVIYQAILKEGRLEEVRNILLLQGRDRFGEPSVKIISLLFSQTDMGQLEALAIRLLHVKTWEELLGVNGTPRRPRGRKKV